MDEFEMMKEAKKLAQEIRFVIDSTYITENHLWGAENQRIKWKQLWRLGEVANALDRFDPDHGWEERYKKSSGLAELEDWKEREQKEIERKRPRISLEEWNERWREKWG